MSAGATHAVSEHAGELEVELFAPTQAELFAEAARTLAEVIAGAVPTAIGATHHVALQARDRDSLLVAWLNELVLLGERDGCVYGDVVIDELTDGRLRATLRGAPLLAPRTQVKAATFHGLRMRSSPIGGVTATVMLDV